MPVPVDAQPAAPSAAPETPIVETAVDQAVVTGDVTAFREARRAERAGKPLTPPAASSPASETPPPADSSPATPEKRTDKRATENRVPDLLAERAQLRLENERLQRELAQHRQPAPPPDARPAAPSPAKAPTITYPPELSSYDTYLAKQPDASYEDYMDARADFRTDQREQQRDASRREQDERSQVDSSIRARDQAYAERMAKVRDADPQFLETVSEDVKRLKPFEAFERNEHGLRDPGTGQYVKPGYPAIAEEILSSSDPYALMRHFSDHPQELHRMAGLHPRQLLKEMGALERSLTKSDTPATPATPPAKTVTDAPPPPTYLGTRPAPPVNPVEAAVAADDVAAYRKARLAERMANLDRRAHV